MEWKNLTSGPQVVSVWILKLLYWYYWGLSTASMNRSCFSRIKRIYHYCIKYYLHLFLQQQLSISLSIQWIICSTTHSADIAQPIWVKVLPCVSLHIMSACRQVWRSCPRGESLVSVLTQRIRGDACIKIQMIFGATMINKNWWKEMLIPHCCGSQPAHLELQGYSLRGKKKCE